MARNTSVRSVALKWDADLSPLSRRLVLVCCGIYCQYPIFRVGLTRFLISMVMMCDDCILWPPQINLSSADVVSKVLVTPTLHDAFFAPSASLTHLHQNLRPDVRTLPAAVVCLDAQCTVCDCSSVCPRRAAQPSNGVSSVVGLYSAFVMYSMVVRAEGNSGSTDCPG